MDWEKFFDSYESVLVSVKEGYYEAVPLEIIYQAFEMRRTAPQGEIPMVNDAPKATGSVMMGRIGGGDSDE